MLIHTLLKKAEYLKVLPKILPNILLRMERILVPRRKQPVFIRSLKHEILVAHKRAVNGQQQHTSGLRDAPQLLEPLKLIGRIEMREHRDRVDEIESIRRVLSRRACLSNLERSEPQIFLAPLDRCCVDIGPIELRARRELLQVDERA